MACIPGLAENPTTPNAASFQEERERIAQTRYSRVGKMRHRATSGE
jgi:hypothetical protein